MTLNGALMPKDLSPDPVLTDMSVQTVTADGFIADKIFPVVPVASEYGKFAYFGQEAVTTDIDTERAIGADPSKTEQSRSFDTFITTEKALDEDVPNELIDQASSPTSVTGQAAMNNTTKLRVGAELRVKAILDGSANSATVSIYWDGTNPTIKKDVDGVKSAFIPLSGGRLPNTVVIPYNVAQVISNDKDILDRLRYTMTTLVTDGDLPERFLNMNVFVGGAVQKGSAAAALAQIWNGKYIYFGYVDPAVKLAPNVYTAGAQFRQNLGGGIDVMSYQWPHPSKSRNVTVVSTKLKQAEKLIASGALYKLRVST